MLNNLGELNSSNFQIGSSDSFDSNILSVGWVDQKPIQVDSDIVNLQNIFMSYANLKKINKE